jgi:hypothetical protein
MLPPWGELYMQAKVYLDLCLFPYEPVPAPEFLYQDAGVVHAKFVSVSKQILHIRL